MARRNDNQYQAISEFIKNSILLGELTIGQKVPTQGELAERFQASRAVVRRAIRDLTRIGLIKCPRGSTPVVSKRPAEINRRFGFITPPSKGNLALLSSIMVLKAQEQKFGFALDGRFGSDDDQNIHRSVVEDFIRQHEERRIAGVFFIPFYQSLPNSPNNVHIVDMFDEAHIPIVLIDRDICEYPYRSGYDLVGIDNPHAGYTLTQYLLSFGYRQIEFITHEYYHCTSTITGRIAGYKTALMQNGIMPREEWIHHGDPVEIEFVRHIRKNSKADAYICASDYVAGNVMHHLIALGIRVPQDVAIVGIDDDEWGKLLAVPLTTMRPPIADIGKTAIQMMLQRLEDPGLRPRQITFECELIVRESSGTTSSK